MLNLHRVILGLLVLGVACGKSDPPPATATDVDASVEPGPDRPDAARDYVHREAPPPPGPPNGPVAPWAAKDIGPASAGEETRSSTGLVTIRAGGADVGGTADSFRFVSQMVSGDFEILARVRSLQMVDPMSKAGIMVRASDDPGAPNVFLAALGDPMKGGAFQYRAAAGGPTTMAMDTGSRAGLWFRIVRQGRTFTAYRSASRLDWAKVGSVDLDLPAAVAVGVAVAARSTILTTVAEIDALRVQNLDAQPVTRGWSIEELGSIGASALWQGATLAFSGVGEGPSLLSESGAFAAGSVSGNQTLTVRVQSFSHKDPSARVALMMRQGPEVQLQRTQPAVLLSLSPMMGVMFQGRAFNNSQATVTPWKLGVQAPLWLRLERVEEPGPPAIHRFTGSYSADGRTWTTVGSARFVLPEPYLAGVLVSSNGSTTPAVATLSDITMGTAPTPAPPPAADAGTDGRM